MVSQDKKFENDFINVTEHPVLIVGQNPGRQREGSKDGLVWDGNRSADFLRECIEGLDNIILTNSCMYQNEVDHNGWECYDNIEALIKEYRPRRVIALGKVAYDALREFHLDPHEVVEMKHPSYIIRFNKNVENYKRQLRKAIQT